MIEIETVGDLRNFLKPFTDEAKITPIGINYRLYDGDGFLDVTFLDDASQQPEFMALAGHG